MEGNIMPDKPFDTLIAANGIDSSNRWYPTSVDRFRAAIKMDLTVENHTALLSNIAYSLQYLEFIEKELVELKLSEVMRTMLEKTYVITGMSIIEGLFTNIIKSRGWWKTIDCECIQSYQSNDTSVDGETRFVKTEVYKRIDPVPKQMDMEAMIQVMQHHHHALKINHFVYPALKRLKGLRNRIHLQKVEAPDDHDYYAFSDHNKKEMGAILYEIMTSEMITSVPDVFDFLKVNVTEGQET